MRVNFRVGLPAVLTIGALLLSPVLSAAQTSSKPTMKQSTTKKHPAKKPVPPLVPVGTDLKVRINDTLSSKQSHVGDRFIATVIDPSRFDEAKVHGHISSIQKSGTVSGRTSINLAFDSIQL